MGVENRLVLKMSGEALASTASDQTIDAATVDRLCREIAETREELDLELAIVVGGGNIWRGATGEMAGMDRSTSDAMGMLGTVINALALWGVGLGLGYWMAFGHVDWAPASLQGAPGFWSAATAGLVIAAVGLCSLLAWVHRRERG